MKANILENTPLVFLNLENRNVLIVLLTKNPKLNDKKNTDVIAKILQENDIIPKIEILIAVSETN